jgi:hypothetical protein
MADNEKPKDKQQQDVEELTTWRKKTEMIGIDIKSLDRENETRRLILRTTLMNQHTQPGFMISSSSLIFKKDFSTGTTII